MQNRARENAHRLAGVLQDCAEDRHVVKVLSDLLDYVPEQLQKDMRDLLPYLESLEEEG